MSTLFQTSIVILETKRLFTFREKKINKINKKLQSIFQGLLFKDYGIQPEIFIPHRFRF